MDDLFSSKGDLFFDWNAIASKIGKRQWQRELLRDDTQHSAREKDGIAACFADQRNKTD